MTKLLEVLYYFFLQFFTTFVCIFVAIGEIVDL
jgi:hypothetical protein